jgi:hypothetical protein
MGMGIGIGGWSFATGTMRRDVSQLTSMATGWLTDDEPLRDALLESASAASDRLQRVLRPRSDLTLDTPSSVLPSIRDRGRERVITVRPEPQEVWGHVYPCSSTSRRNVRKGCEKWGRESGCGVLTLILAVGVGPSEPG